MVKERLEALRAKMKENGIDVYYLNTTDYHLSEYTPEYFKALRYFSGFTGSMATFLVMADEAHIFVDGRYHIQAENQVSQYGITVEKLGTEGVLESDKYLIEKCQGKTIGFDGRCISYNLVKKLKEGGLKVISKNLIDDIYLDRAPLSKDALFELDIKYTGLSRKEKIDIVKRSLDGKCHLISSVESIAYLLNLRGNDIPATPVFLSYMAIYKDEAYLFVNKERLNEVILNELYEDGIIVRDYDEYYDFLKTIKKSVIVLDLDKTNYEAYNSLDKSNKIINMRSIVEDMKATKNSVEIKNNILAHVYDGVAMLRFMKWLKESDLEGLTEFDIRTKLNRFRIEYKCFDASFGALVAYNENAAMMHYMPTEEKATKLHNSGILLVDSGGQYFEGTTDITRTFALGEVDPEIKKYFTIVLKCMLNLQDLKFLEGLCGNQIDIIARKDLWKLGIDYRCGTGHGVGQVLTVHETPPNIRYAKNPGSETPLKPGHIFSDEPGVYFEGKYGIRCENMLLCIKDEKNEYGQFLSFRPLTVVPFDLDLIDINYLDNDTKESLNRYHNFVYESLNPYLNDEERAYLKEATRAI